MQKASGSNHQSNQKNKIDSSYENSSEGEDEDDFVDNLKHFSTASQSRFFEKTTKDTLPKTSTSSNDTTEPSKSFINQDIHKLSSISCNIPNQIFTSNLDQSLPKKFSFEVNRVNYPSNYFFPQQCLFHKNSDFYPMSFNGYGYYQNNPGVNSLSYVPQVTNINMNTILSKNKSEKQKEIKKECNEINSLEELHKSLSNGKQLGNYIKCRKNTETMINLVKKLPPEKISELIEEIKNKLKDIMISNNKFSQKLFEHCNAEQRITVLNIIKDKFADIAMNKWGSFSLQALLKNISLPEEHEICRTCISGKISELAMNKRSNFVLQKLFLLLNEKTIESLFPEIFDLFDYLICNTLGAGLIKNYILSIRNVEKVKILLKKINDNLQKILSTVVGNSFLLQLFEKNNSEIYFDIISSIFANIEIYCRNSNSIPLIIRCLSFSNPKLIKFIPDSFFESESLAFLVSSEEGQALLYMLLTKIPKNVKYDCLVFLGKIAKKMNAETAEKIYKFIEDYTK